MEKRIIPLLCNKMNVKVNLNLMFGHVNVKQQAATAVVLFLDSSWAKTPASSCRNNLPCNQLVVAQVTSPTTLLLVLGSLKWVWLWSVV